MSARRSRNLGVQFLTWKGESVDDYLGACGELVDGMIHWLGERHVSILHLEAPGKELLWHTQRETGKARHIPVPWCYHMVAVIDCYVHDPWHPSLVLPPKRFIARAFPGQVVLGEFFGGPRDGEEIQSRD